MKKLEITADRFMNIKHIRFVYKRISEAPYLTVCSTMKYDMFSHNEGNRNGVQNKRINNFRAKIQKNRFYPVLGHIFVNNKGVILEGNHRFDACVAEGKPIIFMVVDNMTIDEISDYNTNKISPSWKNDDNFSSAKHFGYDLAIILDDTRLTLVSELSEKGITEKDITVGEMYAILTEQPKFIGAGVNAIDLKMWKSEEFVEKARTGNYYNALVNYYEIKSKFNIHKRQKACRAIVECSFTGNKKATNFKLEQFMSNFNIRNFRFKDNSSVDDFVSEAVRIHNIGLPKHLKAMMF